MLNRERELLIQTNGNTHTSPPLRKNNNFEKLV